MFYLPCRGGYDWNREATISLINLYEQHPVLYLPTMPEYHNRNLRGQALQQIAEEFNRKKLTNLTADDIKKKVHGIRTQYLSEIQKIRKSEASGASSDDVYKPKLWFFELLQFLQQGTAVVSAGESSMILSSSSQESREAFEPGQEFEFEVLHDGNLTNITEGEVDILSPCSSREESNHSRTPSRSQSRSDGDHVTSKKRKNIEKDKISGLLDTAVATLKNLTQESYPETAQQRISMDHLTLFGQLVAEEMRKIEDEDVLDELKEKIITTIFAAKKNQRNR